MELDDKNLKILEAINTFNKANNIKACKNDIVKATKLSFHTVDTRIKDLEKADLVKVGIVRRITEIQLTHKGNKISKSQISLDEYTKS